MSDLFDAGAATNSRQQPAPDAWDAAGEVAAAVENWLSWVARWEPPRVRTRSTICRKCTGSPIVAVAGFADSVPHQVKHALVTRMHRVIDSRVDQVTARELPLLHAELQGSEIWQPDRYDPRAGLAPEFDGVDLDPLPESEAEPFLFTLADMVATEQPEPALPRPPLSDAEKAQLRREILISDQISQAAGQAVCAALADFAPAIQTAIARFVEPQIEELLSRLSSNLNFPDMQ